MGEAVMPGKDIAKKATTNNEVKLAFFIGHASKRVDCLTA